MNNIVKQSCFSTNHYTNYC